MSSSSNHQPQDLTGGSQDASVAPIVPPVAPSPPVFHLEGIPVPPQTPAPSAPEDDHGFGAVLPQPHHATGGSSRFGALETDAPPVPQFTLNDIQESGSATPAQPAPQEDDHGFGSVLPPSHLVSGGSSRYGALEDDAPPVLQVSTDDDHGFGAVLPMTQMSPTGSSRYGTLESDSPPPPQTSQGDDHGFGSVLSPTQMSPSAANRYETLEPGLPPNPYIAAHSAIAPIAAQIPLNAKPGARVSLTGEIIEDDSNAPPPNYVMPLPGAPQTLRPPLNAPIPPQRPGAPTMYHPQTQSSSRESGSPSKIVGIVLGVLGLAGIAFGGWYWFSHRSDPKVQAKLVYQAALKQDYKTAYDLCYLNAEGKKKYPDAAAFEAETKRAYDALAASNPLIASAIEGLKTAADTITVGDPVVNGDKADVPTGIKLDILGQKTSLKGTAHMTNDGGIWKLDVGGATAEDLGKLNQDLVGRP